MPFPFVRWSEGVWEEKPHSQGAGVHLRPGSGRGAQREDRSVQRTRSALSPQARSTRRWREAGPRDMGMEDGGEEAPDVRLRVKPGWREGSVRSWSSNPDRPLLGLVG